MSGGGLNFVIKIFDKNPQCDKVYAVCFNNWRK